MTPARPADPDAPVLGYSVPAARKALGNISHSFFYKLAAQGRVKITKIGRRSIVTPAEPGRVRRRSERARRDGDRGAQEAGAVPQFSVTPLNRNAV